MFSFLQNHWYLKCFNFVHLGSTFSAIFFGARFPQKTLNRTNAVIYRHFGFQKFKQLSETCFWGPSPESQLPPKQQNTMSLRDGGGAQQAASSAQRCCLNRQETSSRMLHTHIWDVNKLDHKNEVCTNQTYCGWLRNPAPPWMVLKTLKPYNGMFYHQLAQDFATLHSLYMYLFMFVLIPQPRNFGSSILHSQFMWHEISV